MLRDPNNVPHFSLDSFNVEKCVPTAFAGGTANSRGDDGGTSDPFTLFTVTGDVLLGIYGVCTTDLTGANGTVSVGVTGNTAGLIPLTTGTTIDVGHIWMDTTPSVGLDVSDSLNFYIVTNGLDIIETIGTADITAGNIYYVCLWRPITATGNVVATYPEA